MNWLNKLERRFGRYAISGLMRYIVMITGLVYIFTLFDPEKRAILSLYLDPSSVLRGEIWRLVTFIFIPPASSPIWIIFILSFYYTMGTSLEQTWGSFKFNMFYIVGMASTIMMAFATGLGATSLYLNLSLLLAFAFVFPNYEILLFFVLPVKVKYLAWLNWAFLLLVLLTNPLSEKLMVIAALTNYALFFGKETWIAVCRKNTAAANRRRFSAESVISPAKHECALCGKTEQSDPKAVFAICKICDGQREYCDRHLEKHPHMTEKGNGA